jgi:thiamine kinase-like enzyme
VEVEARAEDVVARLWPGRAASVEVLGGGITNHNLKVTLDGEAYVVRIAGQDTGLLGIDRRVEHEASLAAAAVGVGPEVVAFVEPEGYLVTRFIEGAGVPIEQMREPETLARVAGALRAVHEGASLGGRFDAFRVVEDYQAIAIEHGADLPADYGWVIGLAERIEQARGDRVERPCHNDLLNANFIDNGDCIRIVDWEYAGMGDVFFDLANFAINHELDRVGRRTLLAAYFGEVRVRDERALELMRFMSDFREAMWGVVQTAISQLDFDFAAYAAEHFERLRQTAAEPAFEAALAGRLQ